MNSGLQPLIDQAPLVLYLSASEILLSAAMIYDAISWGGLDWLQPLPPATLPRLGQKVLPLTSNQTLGAYSPSLSLSLSQNSFIISSYSGKYWTWNFRPASKSRIMSPLSNTHHTTHQLSVWFGTNVKKETFVRRLLVCNAYVRLN